MRLIFCGDDGSLLRLVNFLVVNYFFFMVLFFNMCYDIKKEYLENI